MNLNYMEWYVPGAVDISNSAKSETLQNTFSGHGFRIRLNGHFDYHITNVKGICIESGEGKDLLTVGTKLVPGVYLLKIKNTVGTFGKKVLKK